MSFKNIKATLKYKVEIAMLFLAAVILGDLFLQVIPVWLLFTFVLTFQVLFCSRIGNAFIFLLFSSVIVGFFFISKGFLGLGGFFIPVGLILILKDIYKVRITLIKGYVPLFMIFIIFGFSAYLNPGGDYYSKKFLDTFIYGTLSYIGFSVLFINRRIINFSSLAMAFLLWGIFLLRLVIEINNLPGPSNLFHFGFMRDQTFTYGMDALISKDDFTISYHLPGFLSLIGLSFYLVDSEYNSRLLSFFVWILSFMIIFYTGARQNLMAYIVFLLFFILTIKEFSLLKKYLVVGTTSVFSLFFLFSIDSEVIKNTLSSGTVSGAIKESGRSELLDSGLEQFNENPLLGVGFGHYNFAGDFETFPHNLFVELLAEGGITIFSLIIIFSFYTFFMNYKKIIFLYKQNFKPFLIFLPLFVRAMISGNLTTNIIVFSFIFSFYCLNKNRIKELIILNSN